MGLVSGSSTSGCGHVQPEEVLCREDSSNLLRIRLPDMRRSSFEHDTSQNDKMIPRMYVGTITL
jgi:hypothetical protein